MTHPASLLSLSFTDGGPEGAAGAIDVRALRGPSVDLSALAAQPPQRPPRHRHGEKFLKGPLPWAWLERAFLLPGKALHVALLLWYEAGCRNKRVVPFSLSRRLPEGLNRQTARRGVRWLEEAGLVTVRRKRGSGLEVTLNDVTERQPPSRPPCRH